jgi:serine/threonine-protein kinase
VAADGEVCIIMPLIAGLSLSRLMTCASRAGEPPDAGLAGRMICDALLGLHAAHEARSEDGELLGLIHRDVSPQNIIVGREGISRVIDFGIAMADARWQTTREGQIKGKLPYMAREQLLEGTVDRRVDVYAAGVMLWELLVGRRLFDAKSDAALFGKVLESNILPPHVLRPELAPEWSEVVMRAVAREPSDRYPTALEFADALEATLLLSDRAAVGRWVDKVAQDELAAQRDLVRRFERAGAGELPSSPSVNRESSADVFPQRLGASSAMAPTAPFATEVPRRWPWALGLGLLALVVGGALVLAHESKALVAEPSVPTGGSSTAAQGAVPDSPHASGAGALPPPSPALPSAVAPSGAEPSPPPRPARLAEPSPKQTGTVGKPRPVAAPKTLDCSKPYTVGADGIRRVRRECLGK